MTKQLCRWPGSKRRLLSDILPHFPEKITTYYEPFLGAGSMLFGLIEAGKLGPWSDVYVSEQGPLRDVWEMLIDNQYASYWGVLDHYQDILNVYDHTEVAKLHIHSGDPLRRAAAFLYLQETSFNGLWRVNRKGEHNVPRDAARTPKTRDELAEHLLGLCQKLGQLGTIQLGYPEVYPQVAYFDPPYHKKFVAYGKDGFGWEDQCLVAEAATSMADNGTLSIASNSDTPEIRELYSGFTIHELKRDNRISAKSSTRNTKQAELLMILDGRSK